MRELVVRDRPEHGLHAGEDYTVGTMIELPRACFVADRIAEHADFFSFGTNDLTQTALGFSRDDVESQVPARPTSSARSSTARRSRRSTSRASAGSCGWPRGSGARRNPELKLGICGEHGGDPDSIDFFHMAGLDYVSCSPFRVPIARVAAAQARNCTGFVTTVPAGAARPSRAVENGLASARRRSTIAARIQRAGRRRTCPRWPRAPTRPSGRARSPTAGCARRSSATATGSCTQGVPAAQAQDAGVRRARRATTTARG